MAQHDYVIDNSTGANVRADINSALQAIVTNNSGSSAPSATFPFMLFADSSAGTMKIRNAADNAFIELFQLDGTFTLEDGSASTPALAFRDDLNTGIFSSAADTFNVATGGVERVEFGTATIFNDTGADVDLRIEGDTDQNLLFCNAGGNAVGIGTSTPGSKLHIFQSSASAATGNSGAGLSLESNNHQYIQYLGANTKEQGILFGDDADNDVGSIVYNHSDNKLTFATAANMRLMIDSSGNIGIGTSSPDAILEVANGGTEPRLVRIHNSSTNGSAIQFTNTDTGNSTNQGYFVGVGESGDAFVFHQSNFNMIFGTNNTERMRIDSSGNLLHGVTANEDTTGNSGTKLITAGDLQIDGDQKALVFRATNSTAQKQSGIQWWNETGAGVQCAIFGIREAVSLAPGALAFYTSSNVDTSSNNGEGEITERMRLDSSGNVLIGTTSTSNAAVGGKFFDDGKRLTIIRGDGNSHIFLNKTSGNDGTVAAFAIATATKGSISVSSTGTTYAATSDYRLKKNVVSISDGITKLKQLLPKRFNFIDDETNTLCDGFLAHEVSSIVPNAVTGEKDAVDKDGNIDPQQIDQSKLVPLLVAAVQELIGKVEALEAA